MMEGLSKNDKSNEGESRFRQEIYSKVIRAGKRTYFFDVKSTRNDELYLTITESKKKFESEGKFHYEKHKVFLYKEDFDKFTDSLLDVVGYIREKQPEEMNEENGEVAAVMEGDVEKKGYTDLEFEDLNS
jgi:hypothetical protein